MPGALAESTEIDGGSADRVADLHPRPAPDMADAKPLRGVGS
jgi:hypothetical protein